MSRYDEDNAMPDFSDNFDDLFDFNAASSDAMLEDSDFGRAAPMRSDGSLPEPEAEELPSFAYVDTTMVNPEGIGNFDVEEPDAVRALRASEKSEQDCGQALASVFEGSGSAGDNGAKISGLPMRGQQQSRQIMTLDSILQTWSPGSGCSWPGCSSKGIFKKVAALKLHITNMHTNPLVCQVPGCTHKKPFGRRTDLHRHERSVHRSEDQPLLKCPNTKCEAGIKEFARKDHLIKHVRGTHDRYYCPFTHCPRNAGVKHLHTSEDIFVRRPFFNQADVTEHVEKEHGDYECAVGSCAGKPSSKFTIDSLKDHLSFNFGHSYRFPDLDRSVKKMQDCKSNTVEDEFLPFWYRPDCQSCRLEKAIKRKSSD